MDTVCWAMELLDWAVREVRTGRPGRPGAHIPHLRPEAGRGQQGCARRAVGSQGDEPGAQRQVDLGVGSDIADELGAGHRQAQRPGRRLPGGAEADLTEATQIQIGMLRIVSWSRGGGEPQVCQRAVDDGRLAGSPVGVEHAHSGELGWRGWYCIQAIGRKSLTGDDLDHQRSVRDPRSRFRSVAAR